jgi:cysteine desulfurase
MEIYCDSAATTEIDPEVVDVILPFIKAGYGNASSSHWAGRLVKEEISASRKTVADILGVTTEEIFFLSGATEANNLVLSQSVREYSITHAITSKIEHKAVLQPLRHLERDGEIEISYVELDDKGNVDLEHLENLLAANPQSIISLMHANNEIGNLTDLNAVSALASKYNALFHSDTTQTMGKLRFDLTGYPVDFLVGSAHKFHGPKGIGFVYISKRHKLKPIIVGGGQERGLRGGTENVAGIVGLSKALEIAYRDFDAIRQKVLTLKKSLINGLVNAGIPDLSFNGGSQELDKSLPNILNVSFPSLHSGNLVDLLDRSGIAVSGGSACSNLTNVGSHVIAAISQQDDKENVRFSFSKFNTPEEIDVIVDAVSKIHQQDYRQDESIVFHQS